MSNYKYSALNAEGKKTSGILNAHSEREARQLVKSMNLTPLKVDLTNTKKSKTAKVSYKDLLFAEELEGIGHWTQQEAPEEVNNFILNFLKKVS